MKASLLAATIELLKAKGPTAATARAICAEVGVKQPALYYHYGQLEGLHQAAVSEVFQQVADYYQPTEGEATPLERIRTSWQLFIHFSRENPSLFSFVNTQIIKGTLPESVSLAFASLVEDLACLAASRTLALNPFDAAQMLWAGANGAATLAAAAHANDVVNTEIAPKILDALLDYLLDDSGNEA